MNSPPKNERRPGRPAQISNGLVGPYCGCIGVASPGLSTPAALAYVQVTEGTAVRNGEVRKIHPRDARYCARCFCLVNNDSLGGHDRGSALLDPVYCLACSDNLGGRGR